MYEVANLELVNATAVIAFEVMHRNKTIVRALWHALETLPKSVEGPGCT